MTSLTNEISNILQVRVSKESLVGQISQVKHQLSEPIIISNGVKMAVSEYNIPVTGDRWRE